MAGERNLKKLIGDMQPKLHIGEFIFTTQLSIENIPMESIICMFKEEEGTSLVMKKSKADDLNLDYEFVASWITLTVHSSLTAVGLTAAVSSELAKHGISCNVVAAYHHDHIFVEKKAGERALKVLTELAENHE